MKLSKRMCDDILRLTKSEPKDLLKWFRKAYKIDEPCRYYPYLSKYVFHYSGLPSYIAGCHVCIEDGYYDIYDIRNYALKSRKNFNDLVKQFKKMYNL